MDDDRGLVPVTPHGSLVPTWWAEAYGSTTMYVTTLDKADPQQRAMLRAALSDDTESAKEWINRDLHMVGYTLSPASRVVDGEVSEWVRCVIHLDDGTNVAFGSMGIIKSLMLLTQLERPAPWHPPLVQRLSVRQLAGGKNWYSLTDPPAEKADGKRKA